MKVNFSFRHKKPRLGIKNIIDSNKKNYEKNYEKNFDSCKDSSCPLRGSLPIYHIWIKIINKAWCLYFIYYENTMSITLEK